MSRDYDCGAEQCDRTDYHEHALDDYPCPREDCDSAFPHPILKDYHLVNNHEILSDSTVSVHK